MPLMTWLNRSAMSESRMTTDAFAPMLVHSLRTAFSSPAPVRLNARPFAVSRAEPLAVFVVPTAKVVTAAGTSSAITQHTATTEPARRLAPSLRPRSLIQADAQMAVRISPGRTTGTSRRLAQGWSGMMPGRHRTVTVTHPMIISGSAQIRAAPVSRQVSSERRHRRASSARPRVPRMTAGTPMYQITQYRLSSAYCRCGSMARCASFCSSAT